MKKWFLLFTILAFSVTVSAQYNFKGEKGVSSVGLLGGYAVDSKAPMNGIDFRYNVGGRFRLAPSVMYVYNTDSLIKTSTWYISLDLHYLVRLTDKATLYPIAGAGLGLWSIELDEADISSVDTDKTLTEAEKDKHQHLGLNVGLGIEYRLTPDILVGAEFKYNLTEQRAFDQAMFLGRVAYYF